MNRKSDDINKAVLSGASVRRVPMGAPAKPFVAQVAQAGAKGLYEENQRLKAERADGRVILAIDPKRVRFSKIADRDERSLTMDDPDFARLYEDIRDDGQEWPIKVKAVSGDPDHDFEAIAGHRRLVICKMLDSEKPSGHQVMAVLDGQAADLKQHAIKMWKENALRKNPSPWEQGKRFLLWIEEGIYRSQTEIAEATRLDKSTISQYVAVASLPEVVMQAFGDPRVISLRWIPDLTRACKENIEGVTRVAKRIAELPKRPEPLEIYTALSQSKRGGSGGKGKNGGTKSESVKVGNKVMFTLSAKEGRYAIKLGKQVNSELRADLQSDLKEFVQTWLHNRMEG